MNENKGENSPTGFEIAVIGMAGRFPGAKNLDEFWQNLKNGVECISFFTDQELEDEGIESVLINNPNYIKAKAVLEDIEYFDSAFFDYSPKAAEVMDPQFRVFHECAWEALEQASYEPDSYDGLIGVYAGASPNFRWMTRSLLSGNGDFSVNLEDMTLSDKDYLTMRISYKLNLKGPSISIRTTCSTSLVAIHLAVQGLLSGECDIALAGGVTIFLPKKGGYLFQEGMVLSPDGHCRAFDAEAKGSIGGEGVGIVVLKRLEEAFNDRDYIHAVIKGSAVNNDGIRKMGYMAPSMEGQAEVIRAALQMAEVEPESISYIETHGTGTSVGDPIEIEALKQTFNTDEKRFCAIGSVKTNIGHLDCAAGVASFIKTILALKHKTIPPSLHFETPNPRIDFANSPFYMSTCASAWQNDQYPLRAGISSFGIGGTNAHVILEEAPGTEDRGHIQGRGEVSPPDQAREYQLIVLSAKTQAALDKMRQNLGNQLKQNPDINLADAAYTLQVGRKAFQHRRMTVGSNINEVIENLSDPESRNLYTALAKEEKQHVVFMFPGLGAQYADMGRELYEKEPIFQKEMDRCFEILNRLVDYNIKEILYPHDLVSQVSGSNSDDSVGLPATGNSPLERGTPDPRKGGGVFNINQPEIAQLVVFIVEYALAQLLMKWGIKPDAMIGYSFGEYTAACLSGVFSLEDTLKLIVTRGKLVEQTPGGSMLSVPIPIEQVRALIDSELSIAIDNGPSCVVSGPVDIVAAFEKKMKTKRYICTPLKASRALHSKMMAPLSKEYKEKINQVKLKRPQIPYISNVTGKWITVEQASDPGYWAAHLQETVQFAAGVKELLKRPNSIFVEVGPGYDLGALVKHHINRNSETGPLMVNTVKHTKDNISDCRFLLNKIGVLWLSGVKIDWKEFYNGEKRYRLPLPTYPFEGQRYWFVGQRPPVREEKMVNPSAQKKKPDISDWFYIPLWQQSFFTTDSEEYRSVQSGCILFMDESGFGLNLKKQLQKEGEEVLIVKAGTTFAKLNNEEFLVNPKQVNDYETLLKELYQLKKIPGRILHLWSLSEKAGENPGIEFIENAQVPGFYSVVYLAKMLGKYYINNDIKLVVITNHLQNVSGNEEICPEKATILGPLKVIPQEYPNIRTKCIDIVLPAPGSQQEDKLIHQLLGESVSNFSDTIAAYRDNRRWEQIYKPIHLDEKKRAKLVLRKNGVYLITGGLGNIGLVLAEYLAKSVHAKLILIGRSSFPSQKEWTQWLANHDEKNSISNKIRKLMELEKFGAEIMVVKADVSRLEEMQCVIIRVEERFTQVNGIIHAAGVIGSKAHQTISEICQLDCREQFQPKISGLLVLEKIFRDRKLDFCLLTSSLSSVLGGLSFAAYSAANLFMNFFALNKGALGSGPLISVIWDGWKFQYEEQGASVTLMVTELAITPDEGVKTFQRLLSWDNENQVVISTGDLEARINTWIKRETFPEGRLKQKSLALQHSRPNLPNPYIEPSNQLEKLLIEILQDYFGISQVGIDDNFFELGATSYDLIQLNGLLRKSLEKDIPVVLLFEYPTVSSLSTYLQVNESGGDSLNEETDRSQMVARGKNKLKQIKKKSGGNPNG